MKRLILFLASLATLSCTRTGYSPVEVSAALPAPSKVGAGAADGAYYPLFWQAGDRISVNSAMSHALGASSEGKAEVNFVFDAFDTQAPYEVLYPGNEAGTVTLDGTAVPLYASTSSLGAPVFLRHLGAGLSIGLSGELSVKTLSLASPGGENVGGTFSVDFATGTLVCVAGRSLVTVENPSPLVDGGLRRYRLFFAPGTFAEGLSLRAESSGGSVMEWRLAGGASLQKGKMYVLPDARFSARDFSEGVSVHIESLTENLVTLEL